jgi:hypothetical protein
MAAYREVQESDVARCTRDDGGFQNCLGLGIPEVRRDGRELWLQQDAYQPRLDLTLSEYLLERQALTHHGPLQGLFRLPPLPIVATPFCLLRIPFWLSPPSLRRLNFYLYARERHWPFNLT